MKPVNIVERDKDTNEKFLRVIVFDRELDEIREAMTAHSQKFEKFYNEKDKTHRDRKKRIDRALEDINACWDTIRS